MARRILGCILLILAAPPAVSAQGLQARGIEGWVGYATWSGDDAEGVDPGFQFGLAVLAETAPHFAFGGEGYGGTYGTATENLTEYGLNAVFRWSLGPPAGLHAFLQGRIGWTRLSVTGITQDGLAVGPELGLQVPMGGGIRLIVAGSGSWRTYEAPRVGAGGFALGGGGGSAYQFGGRVGLSVVDVF